MIGSDRPWPGRQPPPASRQRGQDVPMQRTEPFDGVIGRTQAESTPVVADPAASRGRRPQRGGHPPRRHRLLPLRLLRVGPRHPEHRPPGRRRAALHQLPRDPAVLADPGRAAHRPEPPHGGDAVHLQLRQRLPAHARPHHRPRRHRGRGAARRGLRHLRRGQMAPVQHGERVGRRPLRPVAVPARVRPLLRVPRGRDRPVLTRAGLRQPHASSPRRRPRRATT